MKKSKYSKYVVTELKTPDFTPEAIASYNRFAKRILWMDQNVVEGAFQMNCSWYLKPSSHLSKSHTHDSDEIIGFFGNNSENPNDLGGEVEFWIEDEKFTLTKSCMIFIPRGMRHCPLIVKKVDRPIFHYSTLIEGQYIKKDTE
jgi:hypothetical protein